jgi:hypothetical protein
MFQPLSKQRLFLPHLPQQPTIITFLHIYCMDITNLFSGLKVDDEQQELNVEKVLDVYDIMNITKNITEDKIVNRIKQFTKNEKKKVEHMYRKIYENCLYKINNAVEIKRFQTRFRVPDNKNDCPQYDSLTCLDYIQNKLERRSFKTFIIPNSNDIIISWLDLVDEEEQKEKEEDERQRRRHHRHNHH